MADVPFDTLGLDHVVIRAADPDRVLAFYRDVLGFPVERTVDGLGLFQLRAGRSLIDIVDTAGELGQKGGPAPGEGGHNMDHLCLRIAPWDEAALRAHLESHGVAVPDSGRRYGADGHGPSIYIQDPAGNTVELKGPPEPDADADAD